ncbi:alkylated dna repair protein [Plasmopara halstedii]|uniref:Alkylated dna repair protein n=1 Tax=Plasmopara halstedii TaxID=4781 RepID=A0A0P1AMQ7_PLAHL|nr:alkylated dna repair protein [Plasmopara halstedii]CEG42244.1 alkylated dna repair protein [Plasmopara halstedii]|eukprot:XP_024578613.1 alkylated dna repair protein [Plasmopara halstedii]
MTATYKACEKRWKGFMAEELLHSPTIIDPRNLSKEQKMKVRRVGSWRWTLENEERPVLAFDNFATTRHGFHVIPSALDEKTQLQFAHACLTEFPEVPHLTNMHQQNQQVSNIWQKARRSHPQNPAESPLLAKLCWAALGYHYDWTARKYHRYRYSPVPELLQQLGVRCAAACGMTLAVEAIIVNYYKMKSSMGGHRDDVEYTMDHPVVSLSLGSPCLFLLGGHTKDEVPLEILLRSGDVVIMGGASRTCYHGVARVLPSPFEVESNTLKALVQSDDDAKEYEAILNYLSSQRINLNVRQVYP